MYDTVTELNFVHKKILNIGIGLIPGVGDLLPKFPIGGGGGKKGLGGKAGREARKAACRAKKKFKWENGVCVFKGSPADMAFGGSEAVMGRYGAALGPDVERITVRTCLPGMVLGDDGLCYNKSQIRNSDREHPRGTRPLGTPGEMAALRKAASFGRRMETTVKRMQKIGVLKKPARARSGMSAEHRALRAAARAPGTSIVNVE